MTLGRRLFLWALVVSLCITGVLAIGTLLFSEFGERSDKILGTTALLSLASLLALPAGVLLDRRRATILAWAIIASCAAGFVLAMVAVWGEAAEWVDKLAWTFGLAAGAGSHAAATTTWQRPSEGRRLRALYVSAIVLVVTLAVLFAVLIWAEVDSVGYGRILGATAVAALLTTLLQPILRRMEAPPARRPQLVLTLDREPTEEAVGAAIEALARHGVRAERG